MQSSQVAATLRAAHPGLEVELVGIDTRGDKVLDVPLSSMEGKEFFTAEIDSALLEGRVDFTVHSLKDLSLERPAGLRAGGRAAAREPARHRDLRRRCAQATRGGRRAAHRHFLAAPRRIAAAVLRAGIAAWRAQQRRRSKPCAAMWTAACDACLEPRGSERHLDGVVLALAGLSRLFADTTTDRQGHALLSQICSRACHSWCCR